ncbi:MAG: hypothetical protein H7Y08_08645 [Rhizobiaceae bacterium]|nr:hypothetical protein [Rhizobiaceae bacterium]
MADVDRPVRMLRGVQLGENVGAAVLVTLAVFVTAWTLSPGLVGAVPLLGGPLATVGLLLIGPFPSSLYTMAVFDITAIVGLARLRTARLALGREATAIEEVRNVCRELGGDVVRRNGQGQSPFFATGYNAIAKVEQLAVFAMTENIRKDAEAFRYEPVALIVERVAGTILSGSAGLRDAQQIGLRLGILGTFIGMSLALVDVTAILSEAADATAGEAATASIITNLSVAFGTSIAGLVAAILLQIVGGALREREIAVLRHLQELAARLQGLYRNAELGGSLGADIDVLKDRLGEHGRDLASHRIRVARDSQTMVDATRDVARAFASPLAGIQETGDRLASLIAEQREAIGALSATSVGVAALQEQVSGHFERAIAMSAETQRRQSEDLRAEIAALSGTLAGELAAGLQGAKGLAEVETMLVRLDAVAGLLRQLVSAQKAILERLTLFLAAVVAIAVAVAATIVLSSHAGASRPTTVDPSLSAPLPDVLPEGQRPPDGSPPTDAPGRENTPR